MVPQNNPFNNQINHTISSRIIDETENWVCVPTVGAFVLGYVLIISKIHYNCFSVIPPDMYDCLEQFVHKQKNIIKQIFSFDCVVFEHGTISDKYQGANSIDHAHIHVVPCKGSIWSKIQQKYKLHTVLYFETYSEMLIYANRQSLNSYLTFCDTDGRCYLIDDASNFPSQFFRMVLAAESGVEQKWNWKEHMFLQNGIKTYYLFKK
jgi:diadenosine tetraphosphate (Ap4A) HIT family hydrolase